MRGTTSILAVLALLASLAPTAGAQTDERVTAENLSMDKINAAIEAGVDGLYEMQPDMTFKRAQHHYGHRWKHRFGHHAVASWALLQAGESYQNPPLYKRINWVLSSDKGFTYDRAMRAQMLAELPLRRWAPWVERERSWLTKAMQKSGGFISSWTGGPNDKTGDNANSLYGVLGLWGIQRSGKAVPNKVWRRIDEYWRMAQNQDGSWGLTPKGETGTGSVPMTAGGVAVLNVTERYLYGQQKTALNKRSSRHLRRGMEYLDENFSLEKLRKGGGGAGGGIDRYYYMWTVQRVGHATGLRTFNSIDWFREGTAAILNQQRRDGLWPRSQMMHSRLLSTAFSLLYLSGAKQPVGLAKVRFNELTDPELAAGGESEEEAGNREGEKGESSEAGDGGGASEKERSGASGRNPQDGYWNNYPYDIWNFTDYASDAYEYPMTWQVVDLDQPPYTLIESPLLYLSTDGRINPSEKQIANLKGFIRAGGLLVCNVDKRKGAGVRAVRGLAERLFGEKPLEKIGRDHRLYHVHHHLGGQVPMRVVEDDLRVKMIVFTRDVGESLQANKVNTSPAFRMLSNLYLYATGKNFRRGRLENEHLVQTNDDPRRRLRAARIRHNGTFNPAPGALAQLKAFLANNNDVDMRVETVEPTELGPHDIAFLTTTGDGALTDEGAQAVRRWLRDGGTLWIDAAGGSRTAAKAANAMRRAILPPDMSSSYAAVPVNAQQRIVNGRGVRGGYDVRRAQYRLYTLTRRGPTENPRPGLEVVSLRDRPAILFSREDVTAALAGFEHWGINGYEPGYARRLVANSCLIAALR